MRINRIYFKDKIHNWTLSEITFEKLTLLVGASGVGKTRILKAIDSLKKMTKGEAVNGAQWLIDYTTFNGDNYTWEGETDITENKLASSDLFDDIDKGEKSSIINEVVTKNKKILIKRNKNTTLYNGNKMPKFSNTESTILILKEEDIIKPIHTAFDKINFNDHSSIKEGIITNTAIWHKDWDIPQELDKIRNTNLPISLKFYFCFRFLPNILKAIKQRYTEIFPMVEDIRILEKEIIFNKDNQSNTELFRPYIQIKEKGVNDWIDQKDISSGMFRTLINICEMYLCPNGSVFLIDEFENSLGVNCISEVMTDILSSGREIQFIITSHHPYIINNIDLRHWKLVTRNGSIVRAEAVTNYISGKSSHDNFMQLIQLDEYQTGQLNEA